MKNPELVRVQGFKEEKLNFLPINKIPGPSPACNVAWNRHVRPILRITPHGADARQDCGTLPIHSNQPSKRSMKQKYEISNHQYNKA